MDEQLTISTPEQVAFHYETAGIGSRFMASLIDHLIIGLVLTLIVCATFALSVPAAIAGAEAGEEGLWGVFLIYAILTLIIFAITWGYFVIFEIVWQGRTPGKRAGKLRVLRRDGQPIGAGEAMVRNLVRIVDFLPGFYGIGLTVMFIDPQARRLGDLAAGTIVVRESEQVRLQDVKVAAPVLSSYTQPLPYGYGDTHALSPQPERINTAYDPLPGVSLRNVTPDDYRLIREMLERVRRGEMQSERGEELTYRLAHGVAARMGFDFRDWQQRGWSPITFLESVLGAKEARGE
jgi:uncharacterized RDD family membrane protein YckC